MNEQQDNIRQYGAEEILRYLSGKLSREETRLMEKAMLDDDLLADSVEGYKLMQESMSDDQILLKVLSLRNRETPKKDEQPKVIPITSRRWLSYAAAAFFVLAAGWWIYSLTKPEISLTPEVASTEISEAADSVSPDIADISVADNQPSNQQSDIQSKESKVKSNEPSGGKKTDDASKDVASISKTDTKIEGQVPSTIQAEQLDLKPIDTTRTGTANSVADTRKMANVSQRETAAALNLVSIDTTEAAPYPSWNTYKKFLESALMPETIKTPTTATIIVNEAGSIEKVDIQNNLSEEERQHAANVMEKGPKWKNKKGKQARAIMKWR